MPVRILPQVKRIALVAHDHKKKELVHWAIENKEILKEHQLFATGTTGKQLAEALQLPVHRLLSGPLGGDQQIGSMIAQGEIDMLIFFWDPMEAQPHDPDIKALLRLGAVYNIPMACNIASADFMLHAPSMNADYRGWLPDYGSYTNRKV